MSTMGWKIAALAILGGAAALVAAPGEAEARRGKGFTAGVIAGKTISRATGSNAEGREDDGKASLDDVREAPVETPAEPQAAVQPAPAAPSLAAAVAQAEPPPVNSLVCLAGCYDGLGRPVRR